MTFRLRLIGAAIALAILTPLPAMARERGTDNRKMDEAVARLSDPAFQTSIAMALASLNEAMMGMKMAPFANAMESMGDRDTARNIDPGATLGDMMGPEGRAMPQELAERVPQMMTGMAGMASAMQQMLPKLEAIGREMKRSVPRRYD
jgi:hypothetical protein